MSSPFQRLLADTLLAMRSAAIRAGTFAGAAAGQFSREAGPRIRDQAEQLRRQAEVSGKRFAAATETLLQKPPREAAASVYAAAKATLMASAKWRIFLSLATVTALGMGIANGVRRAYDSQTDAGEKATISALIGRRGPDVNDREQAIFERLLEIKVSNPTPTDEQLRESRDVFQDAVRRGTLGFGPQNTPPVSQGGLDLLAPPPGVAPAVAAAARRPLVYPSVSAQAEHMAEAANAEMNAERVRAGLPPLPRQATYIPREAYFGPDKGLAAAAAADPTNPHAWVAHAGLGAASAAAAAAKAREEAEAQETLLRKAGRLGGALLAGVPVVGASLAGLFTGNGDANGASLGGGAGAGPTADAFFGYGYADGNSALPRPHAAQATAGAPFGNPASATAADTSRQQQQGQYAYGHSAMAGEIFPGYSSAVGANPAQYSGAAPRALARPPPTPAPAGPRPRDPASVAGIGQADSDSFAFAAPTPAEVAFAEQRARMHAIRRARKLTTEAMALKKDPASDKDEVDAAVAAAEAALAAARAGPTPAAVSAELATQRQAHRSKEVLSPRAYGPPGYGIALTEAALADEKARNEAAKAARDEVRGKGSPEAAKASFKAFMYENSSTELSLERFDQADARYKTAMEAAAAAAKRGNANEAVARSAPVEVSGGYAAPFRGGGSVAPAQRLGTWGIGEGSSAGVGVGATGFTSGDRDLRRAQTEQALADAAARRRAEVAGMAAPRQGYGNGGRPGSGNGQGWTNNPNGVSGAAAGMDDRLTGVEGEGEFDGSGRWGARPYRTSAGGVGGGGPGFEADPRAGVSAWESETDRMPNGPARITTRVGGNNGNAR